MILITRPRKNSLEFQKRLEKLNINSEIQELSKFKIFQSRISLLNCVILVTSPRSLDYLIESKTIENCCLPMPGAHNVSNALAAVAVARHLGMNSSAIRDALANFKGVNRRFTKVGEVNGVSIIDDYGHHPVEIAAVLKAARQVCDGRILAVHQPHRYSRLHSLFDDFCSCFNDADVVAIAEVFSAGEDPIEGVTRDELVTGLVRHGHRQALAIESEKDLVSLVREQMSPGDIVVCLGAGTISAWANVLFERLTGSS